MTLTADRHIAARALSETSGAAVSGEVYSIQDTWSADDETLTIRRSPATNFEKILARQLNSYRLVSVSDDGFVLEWTLGSTTHRIPFTKAATQTGAPR
jgi:hypothetical protein